MVGKYAPLVMVPEAAGAVLEPSAMDSNPTFFKVFVVDVPLLQTQVMSPLGDL